MKLKYWIKAMRLRTLPLALSGTVVGSALAYHKGHFNVWVAVFAVLTALSLQILSNLANDLGDYISGKDNEERIGPDRALQQGWISVKQMKTALAVNIFTSILFGVILVIFGSIGLQLNTTLIFIILGILAVLAALNYTLGKNPYGYKALGDIFVFLFFGLVSVIGTSFLHTHSFYVWDLLPAAAFGMLSAGVLNVNNLRDYKSDRKTNKNTLVVVLGLNKARVYHAFLILTALYLLAMFIIMHFEHWTEFLFLLMVPPLFTHMVRVVRFKEHEDLIPELKVLSLTTFFMAVFFSLSLFF